MDSKQKTSRPLLPILAVIGAMLFWGLSFVSSKAILNTGFPPMTMVASRFLIASIVLIPLQRRLYPGFRLQKQDRLFLLFSALFGIFFYFLCESRGIKYTSASNAALITAIIPGAAHRGKSRFARNSQSRLAGPVIVPGAVAVPVHLRVP